MNLKQANESLNPLGLRVTKLDGEYRVAFIASHATWRNAALPLGAMVEDSAYYTDSIEDAEGTGVAMYNAVKVAE